MVISVFQFGHYPEPLSEVIRIRGNRSMSEYLQIGTSYSYKPCQQGRQRGKRRERKCVWGWVSEWVWWVDGWIGGGWEMEATRLYSKFFQLEKMLSVIAVVLR